MIRIQGGNENDSYSTLRTSRRLDGQMAGRPDG